MSEKISVKYRGFEIEYQEYDDKWHVFREEQELVEKQNLTDALKYCDEKIKREENPKEKFEPIPAYMGDGLGLVTITSITEKCEAWVRREENNGYNKKGERSKCSSYNPLYLVCPENDAIVAKVKEAKTKIEALRNYVSDHIKLLKLWSPKP